MLTEIIDKDRVGLADLALSGVENKRAAFHPKKDISPEDIEVVREVYEDTRSEEFLSFLMMFSSYRYPEDQRIHLKILRKAVNNLNKRVRFGDIPDDASIQAMVDLGIILREKAPALLQLKPQEAERLQTWTQTQLAPHPQADTFDVLFNLNNFARLKVLFPEYLNDNFLDSKFCQRLKERCFYLKDHITYRHALVKGLASIRLLSEEVFKDFTRNGGIIDDAPTNKEYLIFEQREMHRYIKEAGVKGVSPYAEDYCRHVKNMAIVSASKVDLFPGFYQLSFAEQDTISRVSPIPQVIKY